MILELRWSGIEFVNKWGNEKSFQPLETQINSQ